MTVIAGYEADPDEVATIVTDLIDDEDRADPSRLYARATSLLATYTDVLAELKYLRSVAVAQIATETSYATAGGHLGLTKSRVQQFVEHAKTNRETTPTTRSAS